MVVHVNIGSFSTYLHSAFATDETGAGFSLAKFDGAVCVGNYSDDSPTESTDPKKYAWKVIGDVIQDAEGEDVGIDPDLYDLQNSVTTLTGMTNENASNISQLQGAVWGQTEADEPEEPEAPAEEELIDEDPEEPEETGD